MPNVLLLDDVTGDFLLLDDVTGDFLLLDDAADSDEVFSGISRARIVNVGGMGGVSRSQLVNVGG